MNVRPFTEKHIPDGMTARFKHWRNDTRIVSTTCELIEDSTKTVIAKGSSVVNPKDNASKKIGRAISLGRALKSHHQAFSS
ncbi:MAG: hypothetical protein GXP16_01480 [Gammaproteobacteria bacterium]|nr:hypothetical protein [Gammaproteobacteria bacterium]